MRVMLIEKNERGTMWEVHEYDDRDRRWWTAFLNTAGEWAIFSGGTLREVKPDGPTGRKIIAAVEAFGK